MEVQLAGFDLGNFKDVIDQAEQVPPAGGDQLDGLDLPLVERTAPLLEQELRESQDGIEWRAQLMTSCWPGTHPWRGWHTRAPWCVL